MNTATPTPFFAVVVDHITGTFDVHAPMVDDTHLCSAVCELQEVGFNVNVKTRAQRGPHETLEMAAAAFGRELELVRQPGLLRRLSALAG